MCDKFQYRLSKHQKEEIAQNLIDILCKDAEITEPTRTFISNWILTGPDEKRKAFFDVWGIVLRNYLPKTRPILFRSCNRRSDGKITSFTGRLECARKFSEGRGLLIICDTKETLQVDERRPELGYYRQTFYPLVEVLKIAQKLGGCGFSKRVLNEFTGEDEYIMRVNLENMHIFRWKQGTK